MTTPPFHFERADVSAILDGLRWGGPISRSGRCHPFSADDMGDPTTTTWLRLARVPAEAGASRLADLLRMLFGVRRPVRFVIEAGPEGEPAVLVGIENQASSGWAQSVMSPSFLFEPAEQPDLSKIARSNGGLSFQLAPEGLEVDKSHPPSGMMERLLHLPSSSWFVYVEARPVDLVELEEAITHINGADSRLAEVAERTVVLAETETVHVEDPQVLAGRRRLEVLRRYASLAREDGGWDVTTYVGAGREGQLELLRGAVTGALAGSSAGHWIPQRLQTDTNAKNRPRSLLMTSDLAHMLRPPSVTVPGLHATAGLPPARAWRSCPRSLDLGVWLGTNRRFAVDVDDLVGHGFIAGTTGSGKTSTVIRMLWQLWNRHEIPFLVVDPIGSGYERLAEAVEGRGVRFLRGGELRSNALQAESGFSAKTHLEYVATAFKGSFSMPPPIPYVVSQLFELIMEVSDRKPTPTLHDLRDLVDSFVAGLGYHAEPTANIRAALRTRLGSLLAGSRAERHASPDNRHLNGVLTEPTVISLADIGDDEERSFVMALLGIRVAEAARLRGGSEDIKHVLVLEEAHRIMPAVSGHAPDPERGDAVAAASRFFSHLLAEMRAFGQSVLVVDQSPGTVSSGVLKNTNLKIAMRVTETIDQEALGGSIGLPSDDALGSLMRGEAIVSTRAVPEPQTIRVDIGMPNNGMTFRQEEAPADDPRPCCGGADVEAHHASERRGGPAETVMARWLTMVRLGRPPETSAEWAREQLAGLVERYPETRAECLAWVGIRRALTAHLRFGHLTPASVEGLLAESFEAFQAESRLALNGLQDSGRARPYAGCEACNHPCQFRVFADRDGLFTAGDLVATLRREPFSRWAQTAQDWALVAREAFEPWFGEDADDAVTCVEVHALDRLGAPWRLYRQVIGS